jgi:molybdopterin synthase catalytic subunit
VDVGEASIIIAASSPHRREAFQAVQYIIDTVKEKVPIWKKEFYTDGSVWINGKK